MIDLLVIYCAVLDTPVHVALVACLDIEAS